MKKTYTFNLTNSLLYVSILLMFFSIISCDSDNNDTMAEEENDTVENVYTGNAMFTNQGEVNAFMAQQYDRITGSLSFTGSSISSVNNMLSITSINGNIIVLGTSLANLDGLSNISIEDDGHFIQVINNPLIENVDGLSNIDADLLLLEIRANPLLEQINGVDGITNVTFNIEVSDNDSLLNIDGLINIDNPVTRLSLRNNPQITNTNGITGITEVTQSFLFTNNDSVTTINELPNLTKVGNLFIDGNSLLMNIDGLSSVTTVERLNILNHQNLLNIDGLSNLITVTDGSINIINNSSINNFCGLNLAVDNIFNSLSYNICGNLYNPTEADFETGNCSI